MYNRIPLLTTGLALCIVVAIMGCQCKGQGVKAVNGVLEGPVAADSVSEQVNEAIQKAIESRAYECLLCDEAEGIGQT